MHNEDTKKLLEPFAIALRLEQEGRQFFLQVAEKTSSKLARKTFLFLADEEVKHIRQIERFYRSLELSEVLPDLEDSDAESKLEDFNNRLATLEEDADQVQSDIDAYHKALDFENGAEQFYALKMKEADDPRIKKFYRWLIEEEAMHSRLLRSCVRFIEDPAAWFSRHK